MKVLHVVPSYYPATFWGGPILSTKAICDGIAGQDGFDLRVLTTDAAGPRIAQRVSAAAFAYPVHHAVRVAGSSVAPGLLARLPVAILRADLVHLTGVYSSPTLPVMALCRLMGKPLVWSPRGSLQATEEWEEVPRRRAKRAFHRAVAAVIPRDAVIHATAEAEARVAEWLFPHHRGAIIPNAVTVPALQPRARGQRLRLMFLSRLHPKKGLDLLLDAMWDLPPDVTLDIYGDGEAAHVAALKHKAQGISRAIRFHGHVTGEAKAEAFHAADLYVLPSHSENFGIAVAEALAHGVPVLTTDATPWQGVERHGCGKVITLGRDDLGAAIMALAEDDLVAMGARGRDWMQRDFSPEAMVAGFARLYRALGVTAVAEVPA
jgi:glycosyltransferase involved in cell wall biosynthesis